MNEEDGIADDARSGVDVDSGEELTAMESMVVKVQGKVEVLIGEFGDADDGDVERKGRVRKD